MLPACSMLEKFVEIHDHILLLLSCQKLEIVNQGVMLA